MLSTRSTGLLVTTRAKLWPFGIPIAKPLIISENNPPSSSEFANNGPNLKPRGSASRNPRSENRDPPDRWWKFGPKSQRFLSQPRGHVRRYPPRLWSGSVAQAAMSRRARLLRHHMTHNQGTSNRTSPRLQRLWPGQGRDRVGCCRARLNDAALAISPMWPIIAPRRSRQHRPYKASSSPTFEMAH